MIAALKEMHEKCPCITVTINGERLEEKTMKWIDRQKGESINEGVKK